tara:strand:+ start:93044 stop:93286 length:243 start_codon:yes stop_codon:yes gene_type:complete
LLIYLTDAGLLANLIERPTGYAANTSVVLCRGEDKKWQHYLLSSASLGHCMRVMPFDGVNSHSWAADTSAKRSQSGSDLY